MCLDLPLQLAPGLGTHILRENDSDCGVTHFLHSLIRKTGGNGSRSFQGEELAVVAHQGDSIVGDLLTHSEILRPANDLREPVEVYQSALMKVQRRLCFQYLED